MKTARYFTPIKCIFNQVIYKQGNPADYVYIIKEGDFETTRKNVVINNNLIKKKVSMTEGNVKNMLGPNVFLLRSQKPQDNQLPIKF